MAMKKWVDTSANGFNLIINQQYNNDVMEKQSLVISPIAGKTISEETKNILKELGFEYKNDILTSDKSVTEIVPLMGRRLPGIKKTEMDTNDILVKTEIAPEEVDDFSDINDSVETVEKATVEPKAIIGYLGENSLGYKVYAGEDGIRYIQPTVGKPLFENSSSMSSGAFLRGDSDKSLMTIADGFVKSLKKGTRYDMDDFLTFSRAVFDDVSILPIDERISKLQSVIESAIAKSVLNDTKDNGNLLSDMYKLTKNLQENMLYIGDLRNAHVPAPVAISMQRAIGMDDFKDKNVVLSGIESTGLFAYMPNTNITAYTSDNYLESLKLNTSALRKKISLQTQDADYKNADVTISSLTPEIGKSVTVDGFTTNRKDFAEVLKALSERKDSARSSFVLNHLDGDEKEFTELFNFIAKKYFLEGTVNISGSLYGGHADSNDMALLSVGPKRNKPLNDVEVKTPRVDTYDEVWAWSLNMTIERSKHQETLESLENIISDEEGSLDDTMEDGNSFQAPYIPLSKIGKATKMVPRNLDESTRHALERIAKKHPDVDKWVGEELAMTHEQLAKAFSPEQIDAIAMIMECEERGLKGAAITDQMGVGKGRVLAALLWRAHLKGKKPVFMTERPLNLSDIVRDMKHIGVFGKMKILIMNNDVHAIDEADNSVLVSSPEPEKLNEIMNSIKYPEEYDLVLGSYSLFNRNGDEPRVRQRNKKGEDGSYLRKGNQYVQEDYLEEDTRTPQTLWIRRAIDENVYLVTDESHVAAGQTGNIAKNIEHAKNKSGFTVYSSATWGANSKNIRLYSRLVPESVDMEELEETLKKGGETFQETLSSMMVKDGVMRRCEPDAGDIDFRIMIDDKNAPYYEDNMDMLSPILGSMAMLAGDMDTEASRLNKQLLADGIDNDVVEEMKLDENGEPQKQTIKSMQITRMGFGSPLHNISRLFLMSLMAPVYADKAIECLKNGQKPVLQVENTVQSILDDIYKEEKDKDSDDDHLPEFKDVMKRYLKQLTHSKKWDKDQKKRVAFNMAEMDPNIEAIWQIAEQLQQILPDSIVKADQVEGGDKKDRRAELAAYIDTVAMTLDFPAPVIKKASEELRKLIGAFPDNADAMAPYVRNMQVKLPFNFYRRVNEIEQMIEKMPVIPLSAIDVIREKIQEAGFTCGEITGRNREVVNGKVVRRKVSNPIEEKNAFNRGDLDAIIINAKGSTGIDLHAGERFKDQRQRVYMPIQFIADPKKQKQAEGRTARTGQVNTPIIMLIVAGLASEMRLLAMYNTKSRRISANTTSNRDHAMLISEIPDIMNAIGDKIVPEYFEARPDLMKRMCLKSENLFDKSEQRVMSKVFAQKNVVPAQPAAPAEPEAPARGRGRRRNNAAEDPEGMMKKEFTIDEDSQDSRRKASEFFARLILLPSAMAKKIINEITIEYEAVKKELEDRGETPLKPKMIEGKVFLRGKTIVDGIESDDLNTEFDRPVYAQEIVIKRMIEPLRSEQVINLIERGMAIEATENPDEIADNIERHKEQMLKPLLPNDAVDIADAIARYPDSGLVAQNAKLDATITCLRQLKAGKEITFQLEAGEGISGMVQKVIIPEENHRHIPQAYKVSVLVPGQAKPINMSISSLMYDEMFEIKDGYHGEDAAALIKKFDEAGEAAKLESRTILVGNEWLALNMAVKYKLGSMTMFEDDKGVRRRGILVLKKHTKLKHVPASMPSSEMCQNFLDDPKISNKDKTIYLSSHNVDAVSVSMQTDNKVEFRLPGTTSSLYPKLMANELFKDIVDNMDMKPKSAFRFHLDKDKVKPYMDVLLSLGVRPQVSSKSREWVNDWRAKNYKVNELTLDNNNTYSVKP